MGIMSDDEGAFSDGERKKKGGNMFKERHQKVDAELDETLAIYIEEWRANREKEIDELEKLKEDEKKAKEESEAKQKMEEDRKKKMLDEEKQRQATMKDKGKPSMPSIPGHGPCKSKEQLAEEKAIT